MDPLFDDKARGICGVNPISGIKKKFLGLLETKCRTRNDKLYKEYKERYLTARSCCSPKCGNIKWNEDMDYLMKKYRNKNYNFDKKYIKRKFYKCSICQVAVYCSKHCQKIHWNLYNHKMDCHVLCTMSDLL